MYLSSIYLGRFLHKSTNELNLRMFLIYSSEVSRIKFIPSKFAISELETGILLSRFERWYMCIPKNVHILYSQLVYFAIVWYIFPHFGMLHLEKSGSAHCHWGNYINCAYF
jgi:hypothetical protein